MKHTALIFSPPCLATKTVVIVLLHGLTAIFQTHVALAGSLAEAEVGQLGEGGGRVERLLFWSMQTSPRRTKLLSPQLTSRQDIVTKQHRGPEPHAC
jgi:hypothetical protein